MAYATLSYYKNTYKGIAASDADIERYLARGADDIDIFTEYSIVLADLDAHDTELLSKANCAQAENYIANGDNVYLGSDSVHIGSFSITSESKSTGNNNLLSARAIRFLDVAGMNNRSIPCGTSHYHECI